MCLVEFVVRMVVITLNVVFAIAGITIAGLGVALHIQLIYVVKLVPVNLTALSVLLMSVGVIIFVISFLACCGAILRSRCMLICYTITMIILAAFKIYYTVVIFNFLDHAQSKINAWLEKAFANTDLRPAYNIMEYMFRCCGTTGPESYYPSAIPPTCCAGPVNNVCSGDYLYSGCIKVITDFSDIYGSIIGGLIIGVIIVEFLSAIIGWFLSHSIKKVTVDVDEQRIVWTTQHNIS